MLVLVACSVPARAEPCTIAATCRADLPLRAGASLAYYRSVSLEPNETISRAVIVVHGNRRDADRYFERLVATARVEERMNDVALLAPSFQTLKDGPASSHLYWSSGGWKIGNKSRDPKRVSSFTAMDELLARVCASDKATFPKLESVVLIGHSAGGQFVNRYAAGGKGCPDPTVEVRYVVMNPSSYLYLDGLRPSPTSGEFVVPKTHCRDYDEYKYGLQDLNSYMQAVGSDRIRSNLFARRTYYLAGGQDQKTGGSLDKSCEGNLQGPNRLARYENFRRYHALFDGWEGAVFETVPGIGHSGSKMLMSDSARRAAFR
jgi:hypothetical protein